jgi:hypothetical protein
MIYREKIVFRSGILWRFSPWKLFEGKILGVSEGI